MPLVYDHAARREVYIAAERWAPAVHESGHYAACHVLGVHVIDVVVRPDGSGYCGCDLSTTLPRASLVVIAAGPAAEHYLFPSMRAMTDAWGPADSLDRTHWRTHLARLGSSEQEARDCKEKALGIVLRHRRSIEKLSWELVRYGTVSGYTAQRIFTG